VAYNEALGLTKQRLSSAHRLADLALILAKSVLVLILRETTPNGTNPANGAIRYTYDAANRMTKLETHNGSAYNVLAQMAYDGLGNRARLTTWAGSPLTTTYATRIVGQVQILQAGSGGITTTYWYGVGSIGEFGSSTSYYLVDGNGSVRQVVIAQLPAVKPHSSDF